MNYISGHLTRAAATTSSSAHRCPPPPSAAPPSPPKHHPGGAQSLLPVSSNGGQSEDEVFLLPVSSNGGQSGSDATSTTYLNNAGPVEKPSGAPVPLDNGKQVPAGIQGNTARNTNNYFRVDGQNNGNVLTDRPSTKVHAATASHALEEKDHNSDRISPLLVQPSPKATAASHRQGLPIPPTGASSTTSMPYLRRVAISLIVGVHICEVYILTMPFNAANASTRRCHAQSITNEEED